jgi:hypothetical protein
MKLLLPLVIFTSTVAALPLPLATGNIADLSTGTDSLSLSALYSIRCRTAANLLTEIEISHWSIEGENNESRHRN